MKLLLVFALMGLALAVPAEVSDQDLHEWETFKISFGKQYNSIQDEEKRRGIFLDALKFIREHNERYRNNEESYEVGINKFADMTRQEFSARYLGYKSVSTPDLVGEEQEFRFTGKVEDLPDTVDWRTQGAVTPVKDQGSCGSCWAFSATGSLEGQHFLKTKKLVSLSEQNLVDCISGSNCATGGLMTDGFTYAQKYGVDTEKSYPYEGTDGKCRFNSSSVGATATGYKKVAWLSESSLQAAVANVGPVSVAIWASNDGFMYYKSGVYKTLFCPRLIQNHGVLAVGYGTEDSTPYWLVKNSWGTDWGLSGYIKMAKNYYNMCGIASKASYPTV